MQYWAWLDTLPRDPIAWLIADSKTSANHLARYHRDDVMTIHVVRGSHRARGTEGSETELRTSRKHVLENLDEWDAVVFLTREQLDDVDDLLGPATNRHVIPNCRDVPAELPNPERPSGHGVMLAKLTRRKQISHVIKAMNRLGRLRRRHVTLDVWGDGPRAEKLQEFIDRSGAAVRLRGHSPTAPDEFKTASFSLLTSTSEAFGNVILESMAAGCIPISYATPYGPADIITHGVDGFLVPLNDIDALAAQIGRVATTKPAKLTPMRVAAHRRALDFSTRRITERWADLMADLLATRRPT
jgi:poly(glycerol-phosphate) alpha-glucosyltransferase